MKTNHIVLGGRKYRAVTRTTLKHDGFILSRVRELDLASLSMQPEETADQYAERLLAHLQGSPRALELVGAMVLPANVPDHKWTPSIARQTAAHLGELIEDSEKRAVGAIMASVLVPFLQRGLVSLTVSREPSDATATGTGPARKLEPIAPLTNGAH